MILGCWECSNNRDFMGVRFRRGMGCVRGKQALGLVGMKKCNCGGGAESGCDGTGQMLGVIEVSE